MPPEIIVINYLIYFSRMKAATIQEIKQELSTVKQAALVELCLRLGKFKKENKELLTYLLFEANDEQGYVTGIKNEIDTAFGMINQAHLYFAKKSLRKIVRIINKYCRYSGIKETELELRLHFCRTLKSSGIPRDRNALINNLYLSQIKKIHAVLSTLHEDLQFDYRKEIQQLA